MADRKTVTNKSIGNTKKTQKYKPNPIVVAMSLLISQKFVNYGHCQEFLIEDYETKVVNYLDFLGYNNDDENGVKKLLNSNKNLIAHCKGLYSESNQKKSKLYSLLHSVNIDEEFEKIISEMPRDFVNACVTDEALGNMLGVLVSKKSPEVWGYFASATKIVDDREKNATIVGRK